LRIIRLIRKKLHADILNTYSSATFLWGFRQIEDRNRKWEEPLSMHFKRWFATSSSALLLSGLLICQPHQVNASSDEVAVKLPSFDVTVDNQAIDNPHLTYPLIEYKDVTYFPMTWNVGQRMGLTIDWSNEQALRIASGSGDKTVLDMEHTGHFTTVRSYSANIVHFPVTVNGQLLDNESEEYPLLSFQDITYFPMTWRFAVDTFGWKTDWDEEHGFAITTWQRPYFQEIMYDDDNYLYLLYFNGGSMLRVPKDLASVPEWLTAEDIKTLETPRAHQNDAAKTNNASYFPDELELKDNSLYYKGIELVSFQPILDADAAYYADQPRYREEGTGASGGVLFSYRASAVPYGNGNTFVSVLVYHMLHIPAPYTPHEIYSFIVTDGKATSMSAFPETLHGSAATDLGSWIWSYAPEVRSVRYNGAKGIALHLNQDGSSLTVNDLINAQCVQVLKATGNDLIVEAYHLYGPPADGESSGFFRIDPDGTFEKLADLIGRKAYVANDGDIYVTGANTITNISKGTSKMWWDYEIWNAPGPKPDH
jgi:hypothetical protein